jgi:hypothetical protein
MKAPDEPFESQALDTEALTTEVPFDPQDCDVAP